MTARPHPPLHRANYPDVDTWLADLDHTRCRQDPDGRCYSLHCVQCGAMVGIAPCDNGCDPRAWKAAA